MKYLLTFILFCLLVAVASATPFPLKLAAGQHYVVDQNGAPFFIQGDSPWFLTESLAYSNADYYLSNRQAQGYNSIILDIVAQPLDSELASDANFYGLHPFTNVASGFTNLAAMNPDYFTNVDNVFNAAAARGICVFAYPLYDGFAGAGWYHEMAGNTTNTLYAYGQFIGNRYKNFTNLVWIGAGDYSEPYSGGKVLWDWIAAGIASTDANHLITAQAQRPVPASYYSNYITLNSTYPFSYTYIESLANYQHAPVLASFDREPYYENRAVSGGIYTALNCRNFFWWSVTSGDAGCFYGDENQWPFTTGWQAEMWDTGATTITNVIKLMTSRNWWNFVPDASHAVVIGGYGVSGNTNYVTTTREAGGKTVMAYLPQGSNSLPVVALTNINGVDASAWWFNPRTGGSNYIATYTTTGIQTFTASDTNDWVLVLDALGVTNTTPSFTLTVVNGTGSGTYNPNTIVSISTNIITGEPFKFWSGSYIANTNLANTTVTMPATNLTVTANFFPFPPTSLKISPSP